MTPHTEAELRGDLELLNRTVAELVGWKDFLKGKHLTGKSPKNSPTSKWRVRVPNFTGSLDACRTFEAGLTEEEEEEAWEFGCKLMGVACDKKVYIWQLEPQDHCIAFLKLKGVCE